MNPLLLHDVFSYRIYVDGAKLHISAPRENDPDAVNYVFYPHKIPYDMIIVDCQHGYISIEAINWLIKHDISVAILAWNGTLLTSMLPVETKNGKLRISQFRAYDNEQHRMKIARAIIESKIALSLNNLSELSRFYNIDIGSIEQKFSQETKMISVKDTKSLMTLEGRIADIYWTEMVRIFKTVYPDANFTGRKNLSNSWNMNASDPVNALFNYGYAILENICRKYANATGFDFSVGFVHEIANSKTPFIYDVQELFRWLIDLSIIQFCEGRRFKRSDFITTSDYSMKLDGNTANALIDTIRLNFARKAPYKGRNHSYEDILLQNLRMLANHLYGKESVDFSVPLFSIERNDSNDIRNRISNMSPSERKSKGINKSTLWYQKQHIKQGRPMKLYRKTREKI